MKPYYQDDLVTLYCGDWRDVEVDNLFVRHVAITDPPFGIGYKSGWAGRLPRSIRNDGDTQERDEFLAVWDDAPALVFGSWRRPAPAATRMILVWDAKGALGMGDLSLPWKPSHQQIYVLGHGFIGRRSSDVLRFAPVQSTAANGRTHPHEKPVALMRALIARTPGDWRIADPFAGTGATLVAAKSEGRVAVGCEIEERYCEIAAQRLSQEVLGLGAAQTRPDTRPHTPGQPWSGMLTFPAQDKP